MITLRKDQSIFEPSSRKGDQTPHYFLVPHLKEEKKEEEAEENATDIRALKRFTCFHLDFYKLFLFG